MCGYGGNATGGELWGVARGEPWWWQRRCLAGGDGGRRLAAGIHRTKSLGYRADHSSATDRVVLFSGWNEGNI